MSPLPLLVPLLRSALVGVLLACALSSCGEDRPGGGSGPVAYEDIDTDAWAAALAKLPAVRTDPDLETLYDQTVEDCAKKAEDLELGLTLTGARPDVMRVNMKFVCPDKAHVIDDALTNIQDRGARFEEACTTPKSLRTEEQQNMVDAVGCP